MRAIYYLLIFDVFCFQMVSDGLFVQLVSQAVDITEGWTVAQLLSIYSGMLVLATSNWEYKVTINTLAIWQLFACAFLHK